MGPKGGETTLRKIVKPPALVGLTAPRGWRIKKIRFREDGTVEVVLEPLELIADLLAGQLPTVPLAPLVSSGSNYHVKRIPSIDISNPVIHLSSRIESNLRAR
jgi:hypothetical protein